MKKNYIYLILLTIITVGITLLLAGIYNKEVVHNCYAYENMNKIIPDEFEAYMLENPDTIIYIGDKNNLDNNKFEKKLVQKLENLNILENIIYIEKEEIGLDLKNILKEKYNFKYNEEKVPVIIVIIDNKITQTSIVDENSIVDTIINYEVFE